MRPIDARGHLRAAYRQLDANGRRDLVQQILDIAVDRKPEGLLVRLCERWLAGEPDDHAFAHIVDAYSDLDPIFKLAGGRVKGAVGAKTKYLQGLAEKHPGKSAKELHRIAVREADGIVFDADVGELLDASTGAPMSLRAFEQALSKAKNLRKR